MSIELGIISNDDPAYNEEANRLVICCDYNQLLKVNKTEFTLTSGGSTYSTYDPRQHCESFWGAHHGQPDIDYKQHLPSQVGIATLSLSATDDHNFGAHPDQQPLSLA